jgi:hypothetical protein
MIRTRKNSMRKVYTLPSITPVANIRKALVAILPAVSIASAVGCVLCMAGTVAHAMQNEPKDFLGIAWGAPIADHEKDLKLVIDGDTTQHYKRPSDRMSFGGIEPRRITYSFHKGKFSGGNILTVGTTDLNAMLSLLTTRYGEPDEVNKRHRVYSWVGERVGIIVSCDISIGCYTEFFDKALRESEQQAQPSGGQAAKDDN